MAIDLLKAQSGQQALGTFARTFEMEYPDDREESVRRVLSGKDFPLDDLPEEFNPRLIVDIGANAGASTLYFHSHFPDAKIISYEPSVYNFPFLETNTAGLRNVTTVNCALSNESGLRPLFYGTGFQSRTFSLLEFTENRGREMVEVRRASEEFIARKITQIAILKVSAEACEFNILADLFENVPNLSVLFLYVEYHGGTVREMLTQMLGREYECKDLNVVGKRHATLRFTNRAFLKWLNSRPSEQREQRHVMPRRRAA